MSYLGTRKQLWKGSKCNTTVDDVRITQVMQGAIANWLTCASFEVCSWLG